MLSKQQLEIIGKMWTNDQERRDDCKVTLDLYNNKILDYVEARIKQEFENDEIRKQINERVLPINLLKKTTNKIAKVYNKTPVRKVEPETDVDKALVDNFVNDLDLNDVMRVADKYLVLHDEYLLNPYFDQRTKSGKIRVIPSYQFMVASFDDQDPTKPEIYVISYGRTAEDEELILVWDDENFYIINTDGEIKRDEMEGYEDTQGENPYGKAPFVYVNKVDSQIQPNVDEASISMATLMPIMFGDLNYGIKYQSFGIIWGKNADLKNLAISPSATLELKKKDKMDETEPELGQLKPELDIQEVLGAILAEVGFWLSTIGLRPSTISTTADSFSSGISKLIDEADSYEERQENQNIHKKAEAALWDLILNYMNPVWSKEQGASIKIVGSPNASVTTIYQPIEPMITRGELVDTLGKEVENGFTSKRNAIAKLNPELSDEEITDLMKEIEKEKIIDVFGTSGESNEQIADKINEEFEVA